MLRNRYYWWAGIAAAILALCPLEAAAADQFKEACASPSFPQPAPASPLGIDAKCGVTGSGGTEANQNMAKNNFCAGGTPEPITIAQFTALQNKVDGDKSINFGNSNDKKTKRKKGPTVNRAPVQALGEGKLVTFQGFVLIARQEKKESVNCGKKVPDQDLFHDIHISLVEQKNAGPSDECSGVVAEMSPHHRPDAWTQPHVQKVADKHAQVRVTGQLFFDSSHFPCQNGVPSPGNPKRVSLWEIHPIYKFEVCTIADCEGAQDKLVPLEEWIKQNP